MEKKKIISSLISTGTYREFVENIFQLVQARKSSYVCFANVHMLIEAYKNKDFNKILDEADIVTPDGGPLSKFVKLFYGVQQDRVAGMDLLPSLLEEAEKRNKSVYFYGSTDQVLNAIAQKIRLDHPSLRIAGIYSPPFRKLTQEEDQQIIDNINQANTDLLFVALGCPKQENWMASHKDKVQACMLGVGQAFLVYAGLEDRLPKWARDLSLEWVYRLYLEPGRLWKRYLFTNTLFLALVAKIAIKKAIGRYP